MKGSGPRHERETIIRFDEEGEIAGVWTASESVYRKLLKRGYIPKVDGERHAEFEMPKREIKLPRPPSAARIAAGKLMAEKRSSI